MAQQGFSAGWFLATSPPLSAIRATMTLARLAGADSVFVEDHFQEFYPTSLWDRDFSWLAPHFPDPHAIFDYQTLLGALARHAGRMQVGIGVTEPVRRHPVLIAQSALTLAHLTRRPPILGLGTGERQNIEPYGLEWAHPVGRLEEALQIIRKCFTDERPIDFEGEHFHLRHAAMGLRPPPGRVPEIWIAAHGPRMLQLTGQYADGWFPHFAGSPQDYADKLAVIREAARAAGRDPDAITPALGAYTIIAPDERRVRALRQSRLVRYLGLLLPAGQWRAVRAEHPLGADFRGFVDIMPERYDRQTLLDAIAAVPAEVIDMAVICGTPEQVTTRLRAFRDAGMRHFIFIPMSVLVSARAGLYEIRASRRVARALRTDGHVTGTRDSGQRAAACVPAARLAAD